MCVGRPDGDHVLPIGQIGRVQQVSPRRRAVGSPRVDVAVHEELDPPHAGVIGGGSAEQDGAGQERVLQRTIDGDRGERRVPAVVPVMMVMTTMVMVLRLMVRSLTVRRRERGRSRTDEPHGEDDQRDNPRKDALEREPRNDPRGAPMTCPGSTLLHNRSPSSLDLPP